jgi:predicted dinucleotide-binding enzyme
MNTQNANDNSRALSNLMRVDEAKGEERMKIGVLGTGMVGATIATKLIELGQEVMLGSRNAGGEKAVTWAQANGANASQGSYAQAARFGEILFNCTQGTASIEALQSAGADNLKGKILIDVANPLDFSHGTPPTLSICNTDSLGEQIQRTFPEAKVVKTLNTVNCEVMVNPALVPGDHDIFVCGNEANAKARVAGLLKQWFGWRSVIDLGDISAARATEQMMPIWLRLYGVLGVLHFNIRVTAEGGRSSQ